MPRSCCRLCLGSGFFFDRSLFFGSGLLKRRCLLFQVALGDEGGAVQLECSASDVVRHDLADDPIVQTNHCLDGSHQAREPEAPSLSSRHRFDRATALLAEGEFDLAAVRGVLSDRSEGALSISRHPEDGEPTTSNACVIGIPAERVLEACRGPADQGRWVQLPFTRTG